MENIRRHTSGSIGLVVSLVLAVGLLAGPSDAAEPRPSSDDSAGKIKTSKAPTQRVRKNSTAQRSCVDDQGDQIPCYPKRWVKKHANMFKKGKLGHVKRFPLAKFKHPQELKRKLKRRIRELSRQYERRTDEPAPWLGEGGGDRERSDGSRLYSCGNVYLSSLCQLNCTWVGDLGFGDNGCEGPGGIVLGWRKLFVDYCGGVVVIGLVGTRGNLWAAGWGGVGCFWLQYKDWL